MEAEGTLNLSIYKMNKVDGISPHGIDDVDLKKILTKLSSGRERRPRKCRKVESRGLNAILSKLPPPFPVKRLYLSGNERIGDAGMDHLHLLPESVYELSFPRCGITAKGIKKLCGFLETRETITMDMISLVNNPMGDEGLMHIADMLRANTSVSYMLLGVGELNGIGPKGVEYLFNSLSINNKTLRSLTFVGEHATSDEMVQAFCQGLANNRTLTYFRLNDDPPSSVGMGYIKECLRNRNNVHLITFVPFKPIKINDPPEKNQCEVSYLLTLNRLNRKIIKDKDATLSDWLKCVIRTSKFERVDFSFFFLRNNPELCMHSQSAPV